jgi:hypothetical protein
MTERVAAMKARTLIRLATLSLGGVVWVTSPGNYGINWSEAKWTNAEQ